VAPVQFNRNYEGYRIVVPPGRLIRTSTWFRNSPRHLWVCSWALWEM